MSEEKMDIEKARNILKEHGEKMYPLGCTCFECSGLRLFVQAWEQQQAEIDDLKREKEMYQKKLTAVGSLHGAKRGAIDKTFKLLKIALGEEDCPDEEFDPFESIRVLRAEIERLKKDLTAKVDKHWLKHIAVCEAEKEAEALKKELKKWKPEVKFDGVNYKVPVQNIHTLNQIIKDQRAKITQQSEIIKNLVEKLKTLHSPMEDHTPKEKIKGCGICKVFSKVPKEYLK